MGEGSSWLLLGKDNERNIGDILAVDFGEKTNKTEENSNIENILSDFNPQNSEKRGKSWIVLPGFRMNETDFIYWQQNGWEAEDYLPCCGIHSTAAAFGIARTVREKSNTFFVHYNCHASGKQSLVLGSTK